MITLEKENIVFLDIDGVLNHIGCPEETEFLEESIQVLNHLYEKHHIKIVISSSWREAFVFSDLVDILHRSGIKAPIIDKTPVYVGGYQSTNVDLIELEFMENMGEQEGRNREVLNYVRTHNIIHYVILDDFPFSNKELSNHLVLTDFYDVENGGLRNKHIPKIIKILEKEKD